MNENIEHLEDLELFNLLQEDGETAEKAFSELYARHSPRIYAYCRRFLGNKEEAQDVFQEVFVRFYESRHQERSMTNVSAFLLRIARNICLNSKRRTKNNLSFEDYMVVNSENRNDNDELLNLIKVALELLPDEYKDLFILREYDGLSYTELIEITNLPMSTIKIRLYRAKEKIREILAPYLNDIYDNKKKVNTKIM